MEQVSLARCQVGVLSEKSKNQKSKIKSLDFDMCIWSLSRELLLIFPRLR